MNSNDLYYLSKIYYLLKSLDSENKKRDENYRMIIELYGLYNNNSLSNDFLIDFINYTCLNDDFTRFAIENTKYNSFLRNSFIYI